MRLLYFSPVTWHSYYQRPHYLVQHFLQAPQNNVLWINPYPNRLPQFSDLKRVGQTANTLSPVLAGLKIITLRALPLEPLPSSGWLNFQLFWRHAWQQIKNFTAAENDDNNNKLIIGIGRPSKLALRALKALRYDSSFYDAMDDFPEFYQGLSRLAMRHVEQAISQQVSHLIVSSTALAEKFQYRNLKPLKLFNAYNMLTLPSLPVKISQEPLIFGFVGTIGQWFDWEVIVNLAQAFPQALIRLIGPVFVTTPNNLPANIQLLPECSQSEAVKQIQNFSIGLIPFKQTPLTRGVDPIKYYEYRGIGLPILSTRFGEMRYRDENDGVFFIDHDADLNRVVTRALKYHNNPAIIQVFRDANTWQCRFQQLDLLEIY